MAMDGLRDVLNNPDDKRSFLSGVKLIVDMDSNNLRDEIEQDKRQRLDEGRPTEICTAGSLTDTASRILADVANLTGQPQRQAPLEVVAEQVEGDRTRAIESPDRKESGDDEPKAV